jgi:Tfp pilus assembly protein PilO
MLKPLKRDQVTNAIINNDEKEYREYQYKIETAAQIKQLRDQVEYLKEELKFIRKELDRMKNV